MKRKSKVFFDLGCMQTYCRRPKAISKVIIIIIIIINLNLFQINCILFQVTGLVVVISSNPAVHMFMVRSDKSHWSCQS